MSLHFYDGQIRRYITQIVRMMSNFSYKDGEGSLRQVPVTYGDLSRQVASIMRDNSENKLPSAPRMAVYVTGLEMDRNRTSDSSYVSKVNIRERAFDADGNEYLNTQGKNYTVERLMPTPYTLSVNVDIWTTNTDQKLQILEQILMLFNPSLEIQTTDNFVDWTSLSVVNLERTEFSSRSIPVGVESEIDIATLAFSTPIYISPPAKVKRLGVITNVITSIFNEQIGTINLGESYPEISAYSDEQFPVSNSTTTTVQDGNVDIDTSLTVSPTSDNRATLSTTYRNYGVYITSTTGQIIDKNVVGTVSWRIITDSYPGTYKAGISQIRLRKSDSTNYVIGTFTINPLNETEISINWDMDTLPTNNVLEGPARNPSSWSTLDKIVDPLTYNPTNDKTPGLRLMILGDLNPSENVGQTVGETPYTFAYDGPDAWKHSILVNGSYDFVAGYGDIVEWDGSRWHVVFDATDATDITYISNLTTGTQYKWTGTEWIQSYEGEYSHGTWMLYLDA
jgi:hypothetical protein